MDSIATKPAIIWALDFEDGRPVSCPEDGPVACEPERGSFRWLHLNLADQSTRTWVQATETVPRALRTMLLDPERHQRALVEDGWVGCVLHDMERDFDRLDAERDLPPHLLPTVEELAQQLGGIDADMLSINGQLRRLGLHKT